MPESTASNDRTSFEAPEKRFRLRRWSVLHGVSRDPDAPSPPGDWPGLHCFARTPEETSTVGPWIEGDETAMGPYRAWSVPGPLAPTLVGVLAGFLDPLRNAGISVLAISTHDTDWLLVSANQAEAAEAAWSEAGISIEDAIQD